MADHIYGITDTGRVRDNNEDNFIAQPVLSSRYLLACVIDGVGGYHGGEVAAEIAREQILYQFAVTPINVKTSMLEAFKQANENIYTERQRVKEMDSMACVATLALVDVENNQFYYAHLGDTRLYLLRDTSLVKITKDHSFVGFLEDSGRLTEEAAMKHPKRNEINKALGFASPIDTQGDYIETGHSPFLPGDMLLLCSDGLTDMVDKETITHIITAPNQSIEQKAANLIDAANQNGGRDNVTVVLVQNPKTPQVQEATKPASVAKKSDEVKPEAKPVEQQPLVQQQPPVQKQQVPPIQPKQPESKPVIYERTPTARDEKKPGNGLTILLAVLCLAFLGAAVWFYLQSQKQQQPVVQAVKPVNKNKNADELKLQQLINQTKGDTVVLSDTAFKQAILITDTIKVQRDNLYLKAQGNIEFKSDSAYTGPAIQLAPSCRHVVLDNLHLNGFKTGVIAYHNALFLKSVQFTNCQVSVQVGYLLPAGKPISGKSPSGNFTSDSLAQSSTAQQHATR
ncbi:serine/threonine-protein phosphatase [Mucilaginibacter sp. Bleaf8]|uniref:PP2C family protein-serine/threonine phosphatase n=1 Tax=Mucilaginibacter sp. Bleaf8 TaxID=2834430 RepID=UPI001BCC75D0|nr:protein phosphatase 2C domain-containing protein [Mucilaginibacter sp. Bleaf8]MBS7564957.1 serine/threonine-protein phosphatase [Mucilaginibacter sp. Bleaf8]